MSAPLLIRADASPQIGTGHVMRCLALAQAWQDYGGAVTFACTQLGDTLYTRLIHEGMGVQIIDAPTGSVADAQQVTTLAGQNHTSVLVVDGYHFTDLYQLQLKQAGLKVLFIDDNGHAPRYYADWILNQNVHAQESLYAHREPYTRLLLGTTYALLRREFRRYCGYQRRIPEFASRILVTLGGADVDNLSEQVIDSLNLIQHPLEVCIIVGGSNPHRQRLTAAAERSPHQVSIEYNVTDMPRMMDWADAAVTAAGSTLWEIALMGLPALTITLADNQAEIASDMARRGATIDLGWGNDFIPAAASARIAALFARSEERARMSATLQTLVDGYGVERVIQFMLGIKSQ